MAAALLTLCFLAMTTLIAPTIGAVQPQGLNCGQDSRTFGTCSPYATPSTEQAKIPPGQSSATMPLNTANARPPCYNPCRVEVMACEDPQKPTVQIEGNYPDLRANIYRQCATGCYGEASVTVTWYCNP